MDQTSNNQNESDEIKMSRGSVDANEGSLGSGKKKSRFGIGVLVGIVIGAVIITGVWGAAKVVSAVFFKGNFATESTSRSDMEHKLDRLNALIEKYYLYEDEIDKDALVEGIYSGYARWEIRIQNTTMNRKRRSFLKQRTVNFSESEHRCRSSSEQMRLRSSMCMKIHLQTRRA